MSNNRKIEKVPRPESQCRCTECPKLGPYLVSADCNCAHPDECLRCTIAGFVVGKEARELARQGIQPSRTTPN